MNPKLRILERQLGIQRQAEKAHAPATADPLAAAIQAEITRAVQAEIAQQGTVVNPRAQALLRPVPTPSPARSVAPAPASFNPPEMTLHRDAFGRVNAMDVGRFQFRVLRGVDGRITQFVPADQVAEVRYDGKPVLPAPLNRA